MHRTRRSEFSQRPGPLFPRSLADALRGSIKRGKISLRLLEQGFDGRDELIIGVQSNEPGIVQILVEKTYRHVGELNENQNEDEALNYP